MQHPPGEPAAAHYANDSTHSSTDTAAAGAAVSSQRRLQQAARGTLLFPTGLRFESERLGAARLKAAQTYQRSQADAKAAAPARSVLSRRKSLKASAVDGYPEPVWRVATLPASFDARTLGVLSPPKDQGQCAACVAFAVAAAAEAAVAMAQPELGKTILKQGGLSPQQLYFCQSDKDRSCQQVRACVAGRHADSREYAWLHTHSTAQRQSQCLERCDQPVCTVTL